MPVATQKSTGRHYTPPDLARFLAAMILTELEPKRSHLNVLDPACGDGELLLALAAEAPASLRRRMVLHGYDTDQDAIAISRARLAQLDVADVSLVNSDFLNCARVRSRQTKLFDEGAEHAITRRFDAVISNPPYVRTQILGSARAQKLAKAFDLSGRVDLYHAFVMATASVLENDGVFGLLTSNRFLTIRSGSDLRRLFKTEFTLRHVFDLGDTKLFKAAVLPAVVIATKTGVDEKPRPQCHFHRIYEATKLAAAKPESGSPLEMLARLDYAGAVCGSGGTYSIERGVLSAGPTDAVWTLVTPESTDWLATVQRHQTAVFDDVAKIRVGIKSTADEVFIREDWRSEPADRRPEAAVLRPLLRHCDADRWTINGERPRFTVLYPYKMNAPKRVPLQLEEIPKAAKYLRGHKERLAGRNYVVDGGRHWYELWVPHQPRDWAQPKIVFPDIAEEPKFFLDASGAIVNGDCYWITLREGYAPDYLYLILAVANSSFIVRFYDTVFHNKLYAGRRRFMTQYVSRFPLPDPQAEWSQEAIALARKLVAKPGRRKALEAACDEAVWRAFGLFKEI
jgi:predicted RNA methylase